MTSSETFDRHLADWKAEQETPWFRLRYAIAQANLLRHLEPRPLEILDVGGGNGREAVALAGLGHRVALVDFSSEMLADAQRHAQAVGVAERLVVHAGDASRLPELFGPASFDAVLCHNVLQYVDDPQAVVGDMAALLRPGGLVSTIATNRYAEPFVAALLQFDLRSAMERLGATTHNAKLFDVAVRSFTGEEMSGLLENVGCSCAGHYGVLCVRAYISNNEIKYDPAFFAQLEQLELALSDKYPYYLLGRFFQVIGRKLSG